MRYAFPLIFATFAFAGAVALAPTDASYIRIASKDSAVVKDETFTIDVFAGAHVPVNAVSISIEFPKDQIEIIGIDTGESVLTIWTEEPRVEGNTILLQGGTFRNGFLGEHLIANINARAIESGTAKFTVDDITLLAGDGKGSSVKTSDSGDESLTFYVTTTPEGTLEGTAVVRIYTDINGDGTIDMKDILAFMSAWKGKDVLYDFNNDNKMTFTDFAIILAYSFLR